MTATVMGSACRKPDRSPPERDGPGVVIVDAAIDAPGPSPRPDAAASPDHTFCVEEWRVTVPPEVRLRDVALAGDRAILLLEREGTFLSAAVGEGGRTTVAVLQDFLPEFAAGRVPWGVLVSGPEEAMAVYGLVSPRERAALFGRGIRPTGSLVPRNSESARKRYFRASPEPCWQLRGDPSVPESRVWTTPVEKRFLVLMNLWREDRLEQGRLQPVFRHQFAIFDSAGRRTGGWETRASRGAGPGRIADLVVIALHSAEMPFDVVDSGGRRQSGPLVDSLRAAGDRVPVGGGADFLVLAPGGYAGPGIPPLESMTLDGATAPWLVPEAVRSVSAIDTVSGSLLWGIEPEGVWAADSAGRLVARTRLPAGTAIRRYSADGSHIVAAVAAPDGRLTSVVSCVPGGARPAEARAVPLGGAVDQARREAAASWNDAALVALDAIEAVAASGEPTPEARLDRLTSFDDLRAMVARALALDQDLLVAALTQARTEMLAGDPSAAHRAFGRLGAADPARRSRLHRLVCTDDRFRMLRWHPEIGNVVGCPARAPAWSDQLLPLPGAAPAPFVPPAEPPAEPPAPGAGPSNTMVPPDAGIASGPSVEPPREAVIVPAPRVASEPSVNVP